MGAHLMILISMSTGCVQTGVKGDGLNIQSPKINKQQDTCTGEFRHADQPDLLSTLACTSSQLLWSDIPCCDT